MGIIVEVTLFQKGSLKLTPETFMQVINKRGLMKDPQREKAAC